MGRTGPAWLALALSAIFLFVLEALNRDRAFGGVYFQETSSEGMMQTVSVLDLHDEPARSLWYLHIQPPLFDFLRMVIARGFRGNPRTGYEALVVHVDVRLYRVWGAAYACLAGLTCLWLTRLTSPRFALGATIVLCVLHPAFLLYATYLDHTILAAFELLWFYYELWRIRGSEGSLPRLVAAAGLLFLTRSHFQWPFLFVATATLWLRGCPWRRVLAFTGAAGSILGALVLKQYLLFGLPVTSSFAADSGCKAIQVPCPGDWRNRRIEMPALPDPGQARVLTRERKRIGPVNFNHIDVLRRSFAQMEDYREALRTRPLGALLSSLAGNLAIFLEPSSSFSKNLIVDGLPWRSIHDRIFSGLVLAALTVGAGLFWLLSAPEPRTARERLSLALPGLYVVLVSVLFERKEDMRYKFFVEPVLCVLLAATAYAAARRLLSRLRVPDGAGAGS